MKGQARNVWKGELQPNHGAFVHDLFITLMNIFVTRHMVSLIDFYFHFLANFQT